MGNIRGGMNGFLGTIGQPTAQVIDGSLMFNGVNQHLTRTFSSGGNRRTFTLSYWIKEHGQKGTSPTNNPHVLWSGTAVETRGGMVHRGTAGADAGRIYMFNQVSNSTDSAVWTNSMHRDFSGWKHVVFKVDSTQGTGTNRVKIYINGVEQDDEYKTTPSQNLQFQINIAQEHRIGRGIPDDYGNFSLSQYYFIDGQALDASYFGFTDPLTNTWRPKKYTGTYGTTGFWLPMDNQDNFEKDRSGNGNHWTKNNFSGTFNNPNVVKDSPSGAVFGGRAQTGITTTSSAPANYATLNPSDNIGATLSNGNLTITDSSVYYRTVFGTQTSFDGKHYFEVDVTTLGTTMGVGIFVGNDKTAIDANNYAYDANTYIVMYNGSIYHDGSTYSYQSSYGAGDTVGVAIDSKNKKVWLSKNGTYVSGENPTTGSGGMQSVSGVGAIPDGPIYPMVMVRNATVTANFGQIPFKYAPPQGYSPMNSATARPNKVIARPDQYVDVVRYTGSGGSNKVTGFRFQPDLVWLKSRGSGYHFLHDSVRGGTKAWFTNVTDNEYDYSPSGVTSFNSDGFTVNGEYGANYNGTGYVSWCWRAGGNKNTFNIDDVGYSSAAAAGLNGGTITPTGASVGTKQGFSIIGYTGTDNASDTFTHGLTQKPDLVIIRNRDTDGHDGVVYSSTIGATARVDINGNDGTSTNVAQFNNTEPTSSVFTIGTYDNVNKLNDKYICYLWHSVPGLQKFGGYTGNGSDNGPFIETGFRPALIWTRVYAGSNVTNNAGWFIYDTQDDTNPYNDDYGNDQPGNRIQYANLTNAINANDDMGIDILSNGFRLRADSSGYSNWDGRSYFYAAFAEAPAHNLFGGQSNAR